MSVGEQRVGLEFNPDGTPVVQEIKQKTADLIDMMEALKTGQGPTAYDGRLIALAQTAYEEAAMWAVKAATA